MNLNFGQALEALKSGHRVARSGWNGKNMFLFLTKGRVVTNDKRGSFAHFPGNTVELRSHIDMFDAQGCYVSGWL
ncbi:MAG TPA: DUF2829 domain-containing protein, partial [Flavobacteriales bacterium]|nr:DUF2829 domain-containing protein [Flavobacteriales bacterium]